MSSATAHASAANNRDVRLTASRYNALPGEVIILFAEGPGTRPWVGGAASYFEERMGGVWKDRTCCSGIRPLRLVSSQSRRQFSTSAS
jgi:hypothetical protein